MRPGLPRSPFLYPILDLGVLGPRPMGPALRALASGGVELVQLRAKNLPDGQLLRLGREALGVAHGLRMRLVVNDRPDVARLLGADGVHLGQDDLLPLDARRLVGDEMLLGLSTHSLEQVAAAGREPVDYVALGPIFPSRTKRGAHAALGLDVLRKVRGLTDKPLVAIGGISRANAAAVLAAGCDGIALISDLLLASDMKSRMDELGQILTHASRGR